MGLFSKLMCFDRVMFRTSHNTYICLQNPLSFISTRQSPTLHFFSSPPFLLIFSIFSINCLSLISYIYFYLFSLSIFFSIFFEIQNLGCEEINKNIRNCFLFYGRQVVERTSWTPRNLGRKFSNLNPYYLPFSHHYQKISYQIHIQPSLTNNTFY